MRPASHLIAPSAEKAPDHLLDHHSFGSRPSSETVAKWIEFQLPEFYRGSGPLLGRSGREVRQSLGAGQ